MRQQRRRAGRTGRAAVWCAVLLVGLLVAGCGSARPTIDSLDEGQSGGPTKQDLQKFYGADIGFNYALGGSVFRYIEQIKGRQAAIDFDTALLQMGFTEGEDLVKAPGFDRLCARVLGVSTSAAFFNQWASFVRRGG